MSRAASVQRTPVEYGPAQRSASPSSAPGRPPASASSRTGASKPPARGSLDGAGDGAGDAAGGSAGMDQGLHGPLVARSVNSHASRAVIRVPGKASPTRHSRAYVEEAQRS